MPAVREESLDIPSDEAGVRIRQVPRLWAVDLGFSLVDQTKIVTAASELARNTLIHGGGGVTRFEGLQEGGPPRARLPCEDRGPGMGDVAQALRDGFTPGYGLGLGLGGARRLLSEFDITSVPGPGARGGLTRG